ncbi:hypothetical protein ACT3TH_07555 [Psychrobacter sp. AOP22-C1-C5]|uniref:hypothetical protein n=1 Tax=Psychrobacter sp. AOP22-C1-C5 TaxID=3457716 RepID=UPI004036174E
MSILSNTCKKYSKRVATVSVTLLLTTMTLSAVSGCSTTHEFKPTASVLAGAHKSL